MKRTLTISKCAGLLKKNLNTQVRRYRVPMEKWDISATAFSPSKSESHLRRYYVMCLMTYPTAISEITSMANEPIFAALFLVFAQTLGDLMLSKN